MTRIFHKRRKPILETVGQSLILMSFIVAVLYGGGWFPDYGQTITAIFKGSAVGLLAIFVLISTRSLNHFILFLALAASVAGDVLLALPIENSFVKGLGAFLVAQITFIILYLKNRMPFDEMSSARVTAGSLLWAVAGVAIFFLYPHLGDLMIPVFVYTAALVGMATAALFSKFPVKLVGLGAILFVISDSVLGARQFLTVPEFTGYIVWATYYLAELLMTLGVMLSVERRTNFGGYRFD
ncbi:MAG: lysoplasmalogenase [Kordiimonas sp.]